VPIWGFGGQATPATQPSVRVYRATTQSIPNGAWTPITFDTVRYDRNPGTAHWVSGNPTRLTCQVAGTYSIFGDLEWTAVAGGTRRTAVLLNGTNYLGTSHLPGINATALLLNTPMTTVTYLNVGDYVEMVAYQDSGAPITVASAASNLYQHISDFSMAMVGGMQGPQGLPGLGALVGAPVAWLLAAIPNGYREFDGSAIVQATHPQLYALFGATIPDLRGLMMLGASGTYAVGSSGGEASHTLSTNEMPSHGHQVQGPDSHTWGANYGTVSGFATFSYSPSIVNGGSYGGGILRALEAGGGASHNNLPPYRAVRWITVAA